MGEALKKEIASLCPDIPEQVRDEFISQMDPDYLSLYPPEEIAAHLKMSSMLDSRCPVRHRIIEREDGVFDIVIVAFDYFSEFSILCGLIASFGLDILSGHIYTFSERVMAYRSIPRMKGRRQEGFRKKILDIFHVRPVKGAPFDEARQGQFQKELVQLILLLSRDQIQEARARVNRQVVEYLSRAQEAFMGRLYPIQVKFNNSISEKWTVLEIHSKDTPAFLYSFSNALSLRGIYIHKVRIENIGTEVHDRIYLCDRQGKKIEGRREQELLRITTVMIKQFTHFLAWAPDPARAIRYFDQLMDKLMEAGLKPSILSFFRKRETLNLMARLLGTSEFLWEDFFRMQFENLLPILQDFKKASLMRDRRQMRSQLKRSLLRVQGLEDSKRILNEFKDRELFRIDMKHLLESPGELAAFSEAVTELAEVVLDQASEVCHRHLSKQYGRPLLEDRTLCPFAIFGLGKFGGREMGYASDIEVLFIYKGSGRTEGPDAIENGDYFERLAQEIVNLIEARREGIFQVDTRLRPHGKAGTLANSMEQITLYYSPAGEAMPFERQALTKLRWVTGDGPLGREVEAYRDRFVYGGQPWDLATALHLRQRQMTELVRPGTINVKYSPGGVIDIEYAVQYLQIMHGREYPVLKTPSTLEALEGLHRIGIISKREHDDLCGAYLFLRALIDALRIVRGNARDLVLPERGSEEFKFLARRLGYLTGDWGQGAQKLADEIQRHLDNAHQFFTGRFVTA